MKFAQVGYGHDGRGSGKEGAGYTYLVNDNVRAQDKLQPVVRHYGNGALFVTQGKVLATGKTFQGARKPETREIMQKAEQQLESKGYLKVVNGMVVGIEQARQGATGLTYQPTAKELGTTAYNKEQRAKFAGQQLVGIVTSKGSTEKLSKGKKTAEAVGAYLGGDGEKLVQDFNEGSDPAD